MRHAVTALALSLAVLAGAGASPPSHAAEADEEVAYRQLLVPWQGLRGAATTRTKEEALAIAKGLRDEAAKPGANVAAIAAAKSEGLAKGGRVDFLSDVLDSDAFRKPVRALKVGEVSEPFESEFGWNVVQRIPRADALAVLTATSASFLAARFPYAGTPDPVKDRTKEQALADAKKAVALLRGGGRFEDLPPALRAVPYSKKGWLAKTLRRGTTLPEYRGIEDAAFAAEVGGVSEPVDTPLGWIVLRRVPWFHAHVQHLVVSHLDAVNVRPTVRLSRGQARAKAQAALERLRVDPGAWGKVVAETSDDAANAQNGGDLGVVEPGMNVPELEAVIAAMKPGTIAGMVVETRFGFHVLRRLD
jgi:parvulin-like peptidyl-prolyl isomerase